MFVIVPLSDVLGMWRMQALLVDRPFRHTTR